MPHLPPPARPFEFKLRYSAYSYGGGRSDGARAAGGAHNNATASHARESIRSHATAFVELFATGHADSVARLREDGVDILVDLQGHTLGGRSEIAAARPARLQVGIYDIFYVSIGTCQKGSDLAGRGGAGGSQKAKNDFFVQ